MFRSEARPVIVPQSEHLKLCGSLAMLWGNADFDFPPFDRFSVLAGMAGHDRGYGPLDNSPIGGMDDETWNGIARRGFDMRYSDAVADIIAKYHIRRLASHGESKERKEMTREFDRRILEDLAAHDLRREDFDRIDRITELCDKISFVFSFEERGGRRVDIFPHNGSDRTVTVDFQVYGAEIRCRPWPFSVNEYSGYITAYHVAGYPDVLDPVILPYHLLKE